MKRNYTALRSRAAGRFGATVSALVVAAALPQLAAAQTQDTQTLSVSIDSQPLGMALMDLAEQKQTTIFAQSGLVAGKIAPPLSGDMTVEIALDRLLAGSGLSYRRNEDGSYAIVKATNEPSPASAAPVPARQTPAPAEPEPIAAPAPEPRDTIRLDTISVTSRRMEERLLDVPIAVSAFSSAGLDNLKIEGGAELLRGIPNVNFSKDNFTGYNFAIRGIGTKAISVTTDPAVAISFNNTALLRNRLFEQEYFDVERLEVLRGPQGTLYGRNATAGVVNMLPNLPVLGETSGDIQLETGNYDAFRGRGYLNLPVGDTFAIRAAGAFTQRDGYDKNLVTGNNVNGRDLWSTRLGAHWEPTPDFRATFLWEHFEEDDDRSRTGKALCTRGEPAESIAWTDPNGNARTSDVFTRWTKDSITPGCQAETLYSDKAFGTPNGRGFPIVTGMIILSPFADYIPDDGSGVAGWHTYLFKMGVDPFGSATGTQSRNLREIETFYDPKFEAKNDILQLNLEYDFANNLSVFSQSLYMEDSYYATQDYFRINPASGHIACADGRTLRPGWEDYFGECSGDQTDPRGGGSFIDPQLGQNDRLVAVDLSQSKSKQWSQEFRLQSSFEGPFNFNLGANYLNFSTEEDYYVFSNAFTMVALTAGASAQQLAYFNADCSPVPDDQLPAFYSPANRPSPETCLYIDPNPIDQIDGDGHNYYRSLNISETESMALFGEGYLFLNPTTRLTAGLRYTKDKKTSTPVPTQLLAQEGGFLGGNVGKGYPRYDNETYKWNEFTGRFVIDWKPDLSFTDETILYASYSRGYKAGGGNPRGPDNAEDTFYTPLATSFEPEFVNAFEIGAKNALMDGRLTLSAAGFYYDYKDYQISQVIDRTLHNENFDAEIWGADFEIAWQPTSNLRIDSTMGLLKTKIANGETSIDVMNRTQGNKDWTVLRPWAASPATCIVPNEVLGRYIEIFDVITNWSNSDTGNFLIKGLCPGLSYGATGEGIFAPGGVGGFAFYSDEFGPLYYNPLVDAPNQGRGFSADLSGNELPNAPNWTFNIGAQYRIGLPASWDVTLRGDFYAQGNSWMRIYNSDFDKLKGWDNANLSATFYNADHDIRIQAYVKNLFDDTPITDGFVGPDEIGNTTNVFTLDPRLIGVSIRKSF